MSRSSSLAFGFAVIKNFFVRFIHKQARLTDKQIYTLRQTNNIYVFLQNSDRLFRDHIDNLHEIFRRDCNIPRQPGDLLQSRLLAKTPGRFFVLETSAWSA